MNTEEPIKKKRGRKKKSEIEAELALDPTPVVEPTGKKRGRKPKGGKLILKPSEPTVDQTTISNVILHLKCCMDDLSVHNTTISQYVNDPLEYNPDAPPSVSNYDMPANNTFAMYENTETNISSVQAVDSNANNHICKVCKKFSLSENDNEPDDETDNISMKDINTKLKEIKLQLYKSEYPDKKVACFWCTYEYDNPSCYIPKYDMNNVIYGYGSFCRPECAVAHLMKENIDDSIKFERYHLLNQTYGKVYNFKKNIKPAPNPYYLLDKYYGNLSIQEYRKLLKSDHMLLVVDKPMTRILPELHEDNEDFTSNSYSKTTTANNTGVYKVKRQSEKKKGPSKTDIIKETFGL